MIGIILTITLPLVLAVVVRLSGVRRGEPLLSILFFAYILRIGFHQIVRELPVFSHGTGGDYMVYEAQAKLIVRLWGLDGIQYISSEQMDDIGKTTFPQNLFALVFYINDGPTSVGCTAIVALLACLTALNFYQLALLLGANRIRAYQIMGALLFSPGFVLYTSDMFKDGIVLFLVLGVLGSSLRISRHFELRHAIFGGLCILALWHVRFYLIFLTVGPLIVGLVGMRSRTSARPMIMAICLLTAGIAVASYTSVLGNAADTATNAFGHATSEEVLTSNAVGGSAVVVQGTGPVAALIRLIYTLFAPFPWQGGSIALQIGKLETIAWYYVMYRACLAARRLWREDRLLLLMLLTFIVPVIFMYSTIMTNVGLIFRERLPAVVGTTLLATLSWKKRSDTMPLAPRHA